MCFVHDVNKPRLYTLRLHVIFQCIAAGYVLAGSTVSGSSFPGHVITEPGQLNKSKQSYVSTLKRYDKAVVLDYYSVPVQCIQVLQKIIECTRISTS